MKVEPDKIRIELAETISGHWYKVNGKYYPSVTTILEAFPKGIGLVKWIADQGWDESQEIKTKAGDRGSRIHEGIERMIRGEAIEKGFYTLEEWWKLSTWVDWYALTQPEILAVEMPLFSKKHKYAGKVDCICKIDGKVHLLDWKSSGAIYQTYPLQVAAYAFAYEEMYKQKIDVTGIVQLGSRTKAGYRFAVYEDWKDYFKAFLSVKTVYDYQVGKDHAPHILSLPNKLSIK